MKLGFLALVVAFGIWMVLAVRVGAGEPSTRETSTGPEPPPPPAPTTTVEVEHRVQGKTARGWHHVASRYLARVRYLVHTPNLAGHWLERAFLCIHAGEGAWSSNTGNSYYGGLQMDMSFQRTYGDWALRAFGTANNWPASVQVATAIRAYTSGRGFYPWPNTARACGLIR